jgi:hypothetical protein
VNVETPICQFLGEIAQRPPLQAALELLASGGISLEIFPPADTPSELPISAKKNARFANVEGGQQAMPELSPYWR